MRKRRLLQTGLISTLTFLLLISCSNSASKKEKENTLNQVSIDKNIFIANGSEIQFKGLCLMDIGHLIELNQWGEEYIRQASLWKPNIVRFPVHPIFWRTMGKEKYMKELTKGINWAKKYHMYSIIDWHVIGNMKETKWFAPMYETTLDETLDFWKTIAQTYRNDPAVAFYELYNEPTVFNGNLGQMSWSDLMKLYVQISDTIKQYDTTKIELLAGLDWGYDLSPLKDSAPSIKNIAFVTHPYPQKSPQPWPENWDHYFGFATEHFPVFATEFGFCYADQKGAHIPVMSDESYGKAIIDYFNKKHISYTVWVFSWDWYPTLLKDSTYTPEKGQGEFFYKLYTGKE